MIALSSYFVAMVLEATFGKDDCLREELRLVLDNLVSMFLDKLVREL